MKILIINLLLIFVYNFGQSQTIDKLFIAMPNEQIVLLEEAWRKDIIDLYRSGKPATLENRLRGKSTLLKLNDNYLLLQLTERSTLEMRLLPLINNTFIICVITTVSAPVADSNVKFYTTEWKEVKKDDLMKPVDVKRFLKDKNISTAAPEYVTLVAALDMHLLKYSLNEDNNNITAEYMTLQYLDNETKRTILPLLKTEPTVLVWKSGHYE
ncbi:MAG: DUF3256 family protein [Tannerella sp.]|jgi:hypothetical protein|nr:DUF3256 family protein [Tannerella sp.]